MRRAANVSTNQETRTCQRRARHSISPAVRRASRAGRAVRVLLESNGDRGANNEVYALTYDQWTDALANNIAAQGFTPLDINPLFGLTGFTFDGSVWMLLESNGIVAPTMRSTR